MKIIERSKRFWNAPVESETDLIGCYPMGGGGLIEAPYRCYFEVQHLKRIINFKPTMNVLELGCGNGRWAMALAPLVKHYTGVDFSHQALQEARQGLQTKGLVNVELHEKSVTEFKGERPYDVIYFGSVTQYLEDKDISIILQNLQSWINPGAVIIDRSTISYTARQIAEHGDYVAIYRTSSEIENFFLRHGYHKVYQNRTYRFLRSSLINRLLRLVPGRWHKLPSQLIRRTSPASLYLLLFYTWIADVIWPVPWNEGKRSHDFFIFTR